MIQTIYLVPGRTYNFEIVITDSNGQLYKMENDEYIRFGIKEYPKGEYIFSKVISGPSDPDDPDIISIEVSDTEKLDINKKYYYDVGLQRGNDGNAEYFPIIDYSPVIVVPYVTERAVVGGA